MTETTSSIAHAERILVVLDASARGRAALEVAVRIARNTSAELQGLFVEDEDLVRLASLPFSREIDATSASPRDLQSDSVERSFHAAAEKAQQSFADALQHLDLQWTFRVVRGSVAREPLAAATDVDLLVFGQQGRSPQIVSAAYLPRRARAGQRVVAVFDGTPSSVRTLELATNLASPAPVLVLAMSSNDDEIVSKCMAWFQSHHTRAEVHRALKPSPDSITEFVRNSPPNALLINRDSRFVDETLICRLVNELECPLILT